MERAAAGPPGEASPGAMGGVLAQNIQTLAARRAEAERRQTASDRVACAITRFTGSMAFVLLHLVVYGAWVIANLGLVPGVGRFDPSFVMLATEASVEAIFLSTFVLISQNRAQASANRRADLDLHISLLAEHEITKLAGLVAEIAERLDIAGTRRPEIEEIRRNVDPNAVLDAIERSGEGS